MVSMCNVVLSALHKSFASIDGEELFTDIALVKHTRSSSLYRVRHIGQDKHYIIQIYKVNKIVCRDIWNALYTNDNDNTHDFVNALCKDPSWLKNCQLKHIFSDEIRRINGGREIKKLLENKMINENKKIILPKINTYIKAEIDSYVEWMEIINTSDVLHMPNILFYGLLYTESGLMGYYTMSDDIHKEITDKKAIYEKIKKLYAFLVEKNICILNLKLENLLITEDKILLLNFAKTNMVSDTKKIIKSKYYDMKLKKMIAVDTALAIYNYIKHHDPFNIRRFIQTSPDEEQMYHEKNLGYFNNIYIEAIILKLFFKRDGHAQLYRKSASSYNYMINTNRRMAIIRVPEYFPNINALNSLDGISPDIIPEIKSYLVYLVSFTPTNKQYEQRYATFS